MTKIIYTYKECSKDDFKSDISFNEDDFSNSLRKATEMQLNIPQINIEFELVSHPEHPKIIAHAYSHSHDFNFKGEESGYEYSEVVRALISKLVESARKENDKKVHH